MHKFKFKSGFKWLTISATLTAMSLGGWLILGVFSQSQTQTIPVRSMKVSPGKVEDKITGESGILKLDNQRNLKSLTNGTVEEILVKVGDIVQQGQTLIRLRNVESQIKLQEYASDLKEKNLQRLDKELAVQRAKNKLVEVQKQYQNMEKTYQVEIDKKKQENLWEVEKRKLEANKKQQALTGKATDLKEAKVKLEENKQLFARGFISEIELKDQEKKVVQAEVDLTNAQDDLYFSQIELKKQELQAENFLEDVKNYKSEPQQKLLEFQGKIDQAQLEIDQAQLALNQVIRELDRLKISRKKIDESLSKTVITAPMDGTIINLQVKLGDVIEANADLLLIADTTQQVVELKLSPLEATRVKVKQPAEISIVGFQARKITGKVEQVSFLAGDTKNNNQGTENVRVTTIVGLDKNNHNIVPGTPVTVSVIIAQRDNVLMIPNEAIQQNESETFVWMRDTENQVVKRNIKTGLQGLHNIEVQSGLKIGEEVLIPFWDKPLKEGDYVVIKG
jgi:HlyD family secretion protein